MKRTLLILAIIAGAMMVSCNPDDDNNSNNGGNNGGNNGNGGGNGQHNDPEYVDLGLPSGVKWATCNVGASKPEDYGDYFAWGETSPKAEYTSENSVTYREQMGDVSGNVQYDAATANWGGSWRMPTKVEQQELLDNCTWEWTQVNGVRGSKVIGPNGSCIFLPAAGYRYLSSVCYDGYCGACYYWSSTPGGVLDVDGNAYKLFFYYDDESVFGYSRYFGLPVRPVTE